MLIPLQTSQWLHKLPNEQTIFLILLFCVTYLLQVLRYGAFRTGNATTEILVTIYSTVPWITCWTGTGAYDSNTW